MGAAATEDDLHCNLDYQGVTIRPFGTYCLEHVSYCQYSGDPGDLLPCQAVRVAGSVPAFVVPAYALSDRLESSGQGDEKVRTDVAVLLHCLELFVRQCRGLLKDRLGHSQFAQVVQHAGPVKRQQPGLGHAEFTADDNAVVGHPFTMVCRLPVTLTDEGGEQAQVPGIQALQPGLGLLTVVTAASDALTECTGHDGNQHQEQCAIKNVGDRLLHAGRSEE